MSFPFPTERSTYGEVASTNDLGRLAAHSIGDDSLLITASHQTKGRGRRGAIWYDSPGTSALMTYVVKAPVPLCDAWKLSFVAGLATRHACASLTGAAIQVKWPNDIVYHGCKLAGILIEAVPLAKNEWAAVIGLGINVGPVDVASSDLYAVMPTSLYRILQAGTVPIDDVIDQVSNALGPALELCRTADGWAAIAGEWKSHLRRGGAQSGLDQDGTVVSGTLEDVDTTTGCGLVRLSNQCLVPVYPAERGAND